MQTGGIHKLVSALHRNRCGASAAEYALIIASIGAFVVAGTTVFGEAVQTIFESNRDAVNDSVDNTFKN